MMAMCPAELEKHHVLNSDRCETTPQVKSAIKDYAEQLRHKSDPMDVDGPLADSVARPSPGAANGSWVSMSALATPVQCLGFCGRSAPVDSGQILAV